jgi:hypothetical protein
MSEAGSTPDKPGWYPHPERDGELGLWDGRQWVPLTAPTTEPAAVVAPVQSCAMPTCDELRIEGAIFCPRHVAVHQEGLARQAATAEAAKVCAMPKCSKPAEPGSSWCKADGKAVQRLAGRRPALLNCPHCGAGGRVTRKRVKVKRGVSGAKATGAVLTAGLSLFAVGLSRKETVTQLSCRSCRMTWTV